MPTQVTVSAVGCFVAVKCFSTNLHTGLSKTVRFSMLMLRLPPASGGMRYRAVSEYTPTDPRMISMSVGEIVTKEKDEGGWFFGSNSRGEQGYFPSSYVEPC